MVYRKFLLFFILTFLSLKALAAVFVVTSNADSGPGTLRDALLKVAASDSTVITAKSNFLIPETKWDIAALKLP